MFKKNKGHLFVIAQILAHSNLIGGNPKFAFVLIQIQVLNAKPYEIFLYLSLKGQVGINKIMKVIRIRLVRRKAYPVDQKKKREGKDMQVIMLCLVKGEDGVVRV